MEPAVTVSLGPFDLLERLASGGMSEVWHGVHTRSGAPVAVKILTSELARQEDFQESFRSEVRAVARLEHRNIVRVYDCGEVPPHVSERSQGLFAAGSPWLAMEMASLGTLWDLREDLSWTEVRAALLQILSALAHAHARGIVHLDMKLSNVLVTQGTQGGALLKLTDFGIAFHLRSPRLVLGEGPPLDGATSWRGTPQYMAPEQFQRRARDFGPWTDLYGLGCLAWTLLTLTPPFDLTDAHALEEAHLTHALPSLRPRFPVPRALGGWLGRLLAKPLGERFPRAADAFYALLALPQDPDLFTADPQEIWAAPTAAPPLPLRWSVTEAERKPALLMGAGLGLYGQRRPPLVGRVSERDLLWQALTEATAGQGARVVVMKGAVGVGKSRLAEWLTEQVHERAGGIVLRASHTADSGPWDGLTHMLAQNLGTWALPSALAQERIEEILRSQGVTDPYEWQALASFVSGASAAGLHFDAPSERTALVGRFLARLSGLRALVVWLDDAHLSSGSLALADALLRLPVSEQPRALILLTVQQEDLPGLPWAQEALSALMALPGAVSLPVPPLPPEEHRALVHDLLGLEGELSDEIARRTDGNPLFAVELVGDWVERGLLEVGLSGFALRPGAHVELPADLHSMWAQRLEALLGRLPPGSRLALMVAAALGREVDLWEWEGVLGLLGCPLPTELIEALDATQLGQLEWDGEGRLLFTHGMVRESVLKLSAEEGLATRIHAACSRWLESSHRESPAQIERLAHHHEQAGSWTQAATDLYDASLGWRREGNLAHAMRLLERRQRLLYLTRTPPSDPAWGLGQLLEADLLDLQGRLREACSLAESLVVQSEQPGWEGVRAESVGLLARLVMEKGETLRGLSLYDQARQLFEAQGDLLKAANCLVGMSDGERERGNAARSLECSQRALTLYNQLGWVRGMADCNLSMGHIARMKRRLDEAAPLFSQAIELYDRAGYRLGQAQAMRALGQATADPVAAEGLYRQALALAQKIGFPVGVADLHNDLAELARERGDLDEAERLYRQCLGLWRSLHAGDHIFPRMNLALIFLRRGQFEQARDALEACLPELEGSGRTPLLGGVLANLVPCDAGQKRWGEFDVHLARARLLLEEGDGGEPDDAWPLEMGADLAGAAGETRRAREAARLAIRLWERMGQQERAQGLARRWGLPDN